MKARFDKQCAAAEYGPLAEIVKKGYDERQGGDGMEQRRILLTVSYDGTAYSGWQYQDNAPSVQQTLEEALEKALGTFTRVTGASRTDAGVHALGQRAHFDTCSTIPPLC